MSKPWDNESSPTCNDKWVEETGTALGKMVPFKIAQDLERRLRHAEECIYSLLDGLDSNGGESCGLTQHQWDKRIREARIHLEAASKENNP